MFHCEDATTVPSVRGLRGDIISKEAIAVSTDQQDVARAIKICWEKKAGKDFFQENSYFSRTSFQR